MAEDRDDQDGSTTGPSLEPPSLFRRKKKQPKAPAPAPAEPVAAAGGRARAAEVTPSPRRPPAAEPVAGRSDAPAPTPAADAAPPPAAPVRSPATPGRLLRPRWRPWSPSSSPPRRWTPTSRWTPRASGRRASRGCWAGRPPCVTGLLVGVLIVALTAGSQRVCSAVKGTSSCGGPGFFLLVAILVVAVLVGATLLRGARVPDPGSTSFLAVGLLSVVALLFLVDQLFEWWMVIVIPLVSVATFAALALGDHDLIEPDDDAATPTGPITSPPTGPQRARRRPARRSARC